MAEKINKLGQMLVYDSDVKLLDKTPGGKGFQTVTLDNSGAFIDGALTGKHIHYVKSNGNSLENGAELVSKYEIAKQGRNEITYISNFSESSEERFILVGNYTSYFSIGENEVVLTDSSGNTGTYILTFSNFYYYSLNGLAYYFISNIQFVSGDAVDFNNLTGPIGVNAAMEQFLIVSPGEYELTEDLILDGYVSIIPADGLPSIIIGGGHVKYEYNEASYITIISGINTYDANKAIYIKGSTTQTTFKNCSGGDNSFTIETAGESISSFTFENCIGKDRSFFGNSYQTTGYNSISSCTFKNCKSTGVNSFGYYALNIFRCTFLDCEARTNSFGTSASRVERTLFRNCIADGGGFLSGMAADSIMQYNTVEKCLDQGAGGFGSYCNKLESVDFVDCLSKGSYAFGWNTTGGNYLNTRFLNCVALGDDSFGTDGSTHPFQAVCINCYAYYSYGFQWGTNITMKLINCVKESGSFNSVTGNGKVVNGIANSAYSPSIINL